MERVRTFNIHGICYPDRHYMVDLGGRLREIKKMIDRGEYFVINRARQYGKTTLLHALKEYLRSDYAVISMSFQKMSTAKFRDEYAFSQAFVRGFLKKAERETGLSAEALQNLEKSRKEGEGRERFDLTELFEGLSEVCGAARKKVVLMIDEVDQASNNQVFLDFLGQLREYYLGREETAAFHSVILAGVYDIKNLKQKIRPEEIHRYNSPWNVAVSFDVNMSFHPADILTMLEEYEADHRTGMDLRKMSEELYLYTGGYPFLVSCLCKKMEENDREWTVQSLRTAVRDLLKEKNPLFEDVIKNIRNHQEFSGLVEQILINGANVVFEIMNPAIDLGVMFGILKEQDGRTVVSNVIFETLILNYFTSVRGTASLENSDYIEKSQYIRNGRLDMKKVIGRFAAFMKSEYREENGKFIENHGRLLFLSFLRPIINGTGHYAVEPQTRKNRRMDIQVFYGSEEFVVELKVWRGSAYEEKGYDQLADYLDVKGLREGYLVSFSRNVKKPREGRVFSYRGHEICEVIVECGNPWTERQSDGLKSD